MACEDLMVKLSVQGANTSVILDGGSVNILRQRRPSAMSKGGSSSRGAVLNPTDIAAALAFAVRDDNGRRRSVGRLEYLWGLLYFCQDGSVIPELVDRLRSGMMSRVVHSFYMTPDLSSAKFEGLARLAVADRLHCSRRRCPRCGGDTEVDCGYCRNRRTRPLSIRDRSKISGIPRSTFHDNEELYLGIVDIGSEILNCSESNLAEHLSKVFAGNGGV